MTSVRTRVLLSDLDRLSDAEFERHYRDIASTCAGPDPVQFDFRRTQWFDLWALMQLLLLCGTPAMSQKARSVLLLSPRAEDLGLNPAETLNANARLKFLIDMQFLARAVELGLELRVQVDRHTEGQPMTLVDIKEKILEPDNDDQLGRPIIPITGLGQLETGLRVQRDELFERADLIFDRYFSEAIVQEAGLGDCLLSELLANGLEHGNSSPPTQPVGYVALRAGLGLHSDRRRDPEGYQRRRRARSHHLLGDWRAYFRSHQDDPYFELVVIDRGPGIARSILDDPRLPPRVSPQSIAPHIRQHELIRYALSTESSRFSVAKRRQMDRTNFTGLAAVQHVLMSYEGSLSIREGECRHLFGHAVPPAGEVYRHIGDQSTPGRKPLAPIPGTSVTAIIPMKGLHHHSLAIPWTSPTRTAQDSTEARINIEIHQVRAPPGAALHSYLNQKSGATWKTIRARVQKGAGTTPVLVDVSGASLIRNELWSGLTKLRQAAQARGAPLFLCGLDERIASRLEENSVLDGRRISVGRDWLLLAISDDSRVYCFGQFGADTKEKVEITAAAIDIFATAKLRTGRALELLQEAGYITQVGRGTFRTQEPRLAASLPQVRESFRAVLGQMLTRGIKQTGAWLPKTTVLLGTGKKSTAYICLHSVSQLPDITQDVVRLMQVAASSFAYNFVLGIGPIAGTGALLLGRAILRRNPPQHSPLATYYAFPDYSSFDHGETASKVIPKDAKLLLLVDGIRSGDHVAEAIRHVKDSGVHPVAVIGAFDLCATGGQPQLGGLPARYVLVMPVPDAAQDAVPERVESPYTQALEPVNGHRTAAWQAALTKGAAYRYLERNGLILQGHVTFFRQHFARTIPLAYLLNSSSTLVAEVVNHVVTLIQAQVIDTIMYAEHSSIAALVERVLRHPVFAGRRIASIMCRNTSWPDRSTGYELDLVGRARLLEARHVMVIEDETYTGASLKAQATLCVELLGARLERLVVYAVVDSLVQSEKRMLTRLLQAMAARNDNEHGRPQVEFSTFMQLAVSAYWTESTCPLCRRMAILDHMKDRALGVIEQQYAHSRLVNLQPRAIDQDLGARSHLRQLSSPQTVTRRLLPEPVTLATLEGLALYCEEAYVEGDLAWLVAKLHPGDPDGFRDPVLLLLVIELLSRDLQLLWRMGVRAIFLDHLNALVGNRTFEGRNQARLFELLCTWPLHCLAEVWENLVAVFLAARGDDFIEAYGGAHLLITEVVDRLDHPLRTSMLRQFDDAVLKLHGETLENERPQRIRVHLAMCLRTGVRYAEHRTRTAGELISELCFLLGYFAPDKEGHKVFHHGLDSLLKCTEPKQGGRFAHVMQIAAHISSALGILRQLNAEAAGRFQGPDYEEVIATLSDLQRCYLKLVANPTPIRFGRLLEAAEHVRERLYLDQNHAHFATVARTYLNEFRFTLRRALTAIYILQAKHSGEILLREEMSPGDLDSEDCQFVLNDKARLYIFDELATNLERAYDRWVKRQAQATRSELFGEPFTVILRVIKSIEYVSFTLANPCLPEEYDSIIEQPGHGIRAIKSAAAALGHEYDHSFDKEHQQLHQRLQLRRIYR